MKMGLTEQNKGVNIYIYREGRGGKQGFSQVAVRLSCGRPLFQEKINKTDLVDLQSAIS